MKVTDETGVTLWEYLAINASVKNNQKIYYQIQTIMNKGSLH